ncbi:MAG: methionine synthase [Armatimonadetes bacterium]|nr:methionine synthase [Armatimonadota bacterium]MDW8121095.1 methionine synthase [Armatimonadota bacterium]
MQIELPILPVTSVGSFPKPDYLREARNKFRRGLLSRSELESLEKQATREVIALQEEVGADLLVHGEMERGDMVEYFADHLKGFGRKGLVRSYGNRYYYKPVITGEIERPEPITLEMILFAQSLTKKPVKGMLTGPYTIYDWSFDDHYDPFDKDRSGRRQAVLALAHAIRQEVEDLRKNGIVFIQIDEPAVPTHPSDIDIALEAMEYLTKGISAFFITHMCYGDLRPIYDKLMAFPVHQFDWEFTNNADKLFPLIQQFGYPSEKSIGLGVVDVHSRRLESPQEIEQRIRQALQFFRPDQIFPDPDCGLKTRTWEEAKEKMRRIVEGTQTIREELARTGGPRKLVFEFNGSVKVTPKS